MKTPNMSSITSILEESLQNFSLNHHNNYSSSGGGGGVGSGIGSGSGDFQENKHPLSNGTFETTYDLNSRVSLPYHWEQCLDLKTGELYYINWGTGMKAKEDPRTGAAGWNGDFDEYSSEDDDSSSYGSEYSSAEESPPPFSRNQYINRINCNTFNGNDNQTNEINNDVLVVGGCKSCMMYFMVPKQEEECPKCSGQLLHFDKPENASSS